MHTHKVLAPPTITRVSTDDCNLGQCSDDQLLQSREIEVFDPRHKQLQVLQP